MKVEDVMNKNVVFASEEDYLSKIVNIMIKNRFHQVPIVNKEFEGMIFIKDILKVKSDLTKTKAKVILKKVPSLKKEDSIENAIKLLLETGLRALPVVEDGKTVGILSEVDVILKINFRNVKASEIMNKPITIEENEKLKKAMRIMEKNNISSLPIINWGEKLVGCINIFSFVEYLAKEKSRIESLKSAKEKISFFDNSVKNFSFYPNVCKKDDNIEELKSLFKNGEEIIVLENEKPVGILKPRDFISLFATKEKAVLVCSGIKNEEVESVFSRFLEKWKKMGVQKVFVMVEKIGAKEKYEGKIKSVGESKSFMASAVAMIK